MLLHKSIPGGFFFILSWSSNQTKDIYGLPWHKGWETLPQLTLHIRRTLSILFWWPRTLSALRVEVLNIISFTGFFISELFPDRHSVFPRTIQYYYGFNCWRYTMHWRGYRFIYIDYNFCFCVNCKCKHFNFSLITTSHRKMPIFRCSSTQYTLNEFVGNITDYVSHCNNVRRACQCIKNDIITRIRVVAVHAISFWRRHLLVGSRSCEKLPRPFRQ